MVRLLQIMVFAWIFALLVGCNDAGKNEPIWKDTKIGDLAPPHSGKQKDSQLLKAINLNVYIIEVPAGNIGALDKLWQTLYEKQLQFNNYNAFKANSFLIGFGKPQIWNEVTKLLLDAGDEKNIEKVSLLLLNNQPNDLFVTPLYAEQSVFYISDNGSMEGVTIGPGELVLRIKAEKIPGSRGVCKVYACPVFPAPIRSPIEKSTVGVESEDYSFTSVGFTLKMSPGDFFLLAPKEYAGHEATLASLFFSGPQRRPIVKVYLVVCTRIND